MRGSLPSHVALTSADPPYAPRPWSAVHDDLLASRGGDVHVLIAGGEPTGSPDLLRALRTTRQFGLKPILVSHAAALAAAPRVAAVVQAGMHELCVHLRAPTAELHDQRVGIPNAFRAATKALQHASTHERVQRSLGLSCEGDAGEPADWIALAHQLGADLRVLPRTTPGAPAAHVPDEQASAWLDALWLAADHAGVRVLVSSLVAHPVPRATAPATAGAEIVLEIALQGWVPERARAGIRPVRPPTPAQAHHLAALGAPSIGLPACLDGVEPEPTGVHAPACAACPVRPACPGGPESMLDHLAPRPGWAPLPPGARVQVLQPLRTDRLMVLSTLGALSRSLQARGLNTTLHSAWDLEFDPSDVTAIQEPGPLARLGWRAWRFLTGRRTPLDLYLPPRHLLGHPLRYDEPEFRARIVDAQFWEGLDFTGVDLVVVPGFGGAAKVLDHPTFPVDARVMIIDFHLLDGVDTLAARTLPEGDRHAQETWWPTERLTVQSCFPHYAHLYRARGVPLRQVHWRPYPLYQGHFGAGPDVTGCAHAFAGGRHFRDYATLTAAAGLLRNTPPIEVHADATPDLRPAPPLVLRGTTPLPTYYEAIRTSRFVVIPLHHDASCASGISAVAMAFAAGRPVVTTIAGGTLDHVRHGVDGLLVPPGDPAALAEAIQRLSDDPVLLARLADGARAAGRKMGVEAWADAIARGASPTGPRRGEDGTWRVW
jgi:hypothetical protein